MGDVMAGSVGPASDVPSEKAIGGTAQRRKQAKVETREVRDGYS